MGKLYHGSSKRGLTRIEPHQSTHGNYVYATPYKELAIIFSARCGDDFTYALFRHSKNEPWQMVERIPEAFNTMFNNSSSIYTLDDATFKDIHTGFSEVVSQVGVNVEGEEYLENVYDSIKKLADEGKIKLYFYPDKPYGIPEDSSDLIDKQIKQCERSKRPVTKEAFSRLVLLHPYLIDKVNQKMLELGVDTEPYKKEDLIDLFSEAVSMQSINPNKEQYLNSIVISISNIYPELLSVLKEKLNILDNSVEEKSHTGR